MGRSRLALRSMPQPGRESAPAVRPSASTAPPRAAAPPLAQHLHALQRAIGNRAVARIVSPRTPARRSVARVPWTPADTIAAAALSPQLAAALALARANPDALPNLPAYVMPNAEVGMEWTRWRDDEYADFLQKAKPGWDKLPAVAQSKLGNIGAYSQAAWTKKLPSVRQGFESRVQSEFKWNATFNNTNGDLPGTAGAGGYREYYAEPNAGYVSPGYTWGRNRILHKVDAVGGHLDSWWVTDDHYVNFKLVT
jgi:ribonuclease